MSKSRRTIVVCGAGLAGNLAALSLAQSLGESTRIIQIVPKQSGSGDVFYGSATAPQAYNFLHAIGLTEARLILETQTSFSFGTHFKTWPSPHAFMLAHHAPFPRPSGIPLRHFISRSGAALSPLLVSAQAAINARFAHPPQDPRNPLSRAEYGYQFDAGEWTQLLMALISDSPVHRVTEDNATVELGAGVIRALLLNSGDRITGDLFVDATGPDRLCLSALGASYTARRTVCAIQKSQSTPQLGPPCRIIEASETGWASRTSLQDREVRLSLSAPDASSAEPYTSQIALGAVDEAWIGNCVGIGHSAAALEPLTPAPMMLLQRDIERLQGLVPVDADMTTERREFNRRFKDDVSQAKSFQDALYLAPSLPLEPFWAAAGADADSPGLARKIAQFENRGVLVNYDLEPFNEEDWTQNHFGMGRQPKHHDRQLDTIPVEQAESSLTQLRNSIAQLVSQMPPHTRYVDRFKAYLEKQKHA